MKLHTQTKLDETVCVNQERQHMLTLFLSYLPLPRAAEDFGHFFAKSNKG